MLDTLRKHSRSGVIAVFFAIIILVFVFSGPGSGCRSGSLGGSTIAATVNGKDINTVEFQRAYQRSLREYQAQTGGAFDEAMAAKLGLRGQVMDRLIEGELLNQLAAENGIRVSDQALSAEIAKIPSFQKDGAFDPDTYQLIVTRQMGSNPAAFEQEMRQSLLTQKFLSGLMSSSQASDDEVQADFVKQHEKVELDFVRFPATRFAADVKPATDEAAAAYLKDNGAKAEEWYKHNAYKLKLAEKKDFKDVQADVAKKMLDEESAKKLAEAKAKAVLAEVKGGKTLAELFPAPAEDAEPTVEDANKIKVESTGSFSASADFIPRIGNEPALSKSAAALTGDKPTPDAPFEVNDAYLVVSLKSREHADLAQMKTQMDTLREDLRQRKSETMLQTLLDVAKAKAKIMRNPELDGAVASLPIE